MLLEDAIWFQCILWYPLHHLLPPLAHLQAHKTSELEAYQQHSFLKLNSLVFQVNNVSPHSCPNNMHDAVGNYSSNHMHSGGQAKALPSI